MSHIDFAASQVMVRTKASGLLSRLAHDLEIAAERFSGEVERDGATWSAQLEFPVRDLRVKGAVRGDRVEPLSASDCAEIERRMRDDVLPVDNVKVNVSGNLEGGEARVRIGKREQRVPFSITTSEQRSHGRLALSLAALGVREIKGPLGAFKVSDAVEVRFSLVLADG